MATTERRDPSAPGPEQLRAPGLTLVKRHLPCYTSGYAHTAGPDHALRAAPHEQGERHGPDRASTASLRRGGTVVGALDVRLSGLGGCDDAAHLGCWRSILGTASDCSPRTCLPSRSVAPSTGHAVTMRAKSNALFSLGSDGSRRERSLATRTTPTSVSEAHRCAAFGWGTWGARGGSEDRLLSLSGLPGGGG